MPCSQCKKSKVRPASQTLNTLPETTYMPEIPSILERHGISFALCSKKSNVILHARPSLDGDNVDTTLLNIESPQSIAQHDDTIAIATKSDVLVLRAVVRRRRDVGNAMSYARINSIMTNDVELHDLSFDKDGALFFANPLFSCLSQLDIIHNFVPRWKPEFITEYAPDKRCNLNGLAMRDGVPRYMTALSNTNDSQSRDLSSGQAIPCTDCDGSGALTVYNPQYWNANIENSGVIMDMIEGTMIEGLSVPNSPRWYQNELWFLEAGRGKLCKVVNGKSVDVADIPSFARGLDFVANLAFVGISPTRRTADTENLPIVQEIQRAELAASNAKAELQRVNDDVNASEEQRVLATENEKVASDALKVIQEDNTGCGVIVVDILRGEVLGYYQVDNIDEINDVKLLPKTATLDLTHINRGQRNVFRTPHKRYRH